MLQKALIADLQAPYHDPNYVKAVANYCKAVKPDEVGQIGDLIDLPQPSRWNANTRGMYAQTLKRDIEATKRILDLIPFNWVKKGNHDERAEKAIERHVPWLSGYEPILMENMLGLTERGIRLERKPFRVAPGWIAAHGDEGSLSSIAGRTAFSLAKKWDANVVIGHCHRAGIVSEQVGFNGRFRQITGMEVGHGMALKHATYVKSGTPNWRQAFGVLWVDGNKTYPELVFVESGRFVIGGKAYAS